MSLIRPYRSGFQKGFNSYPNTNQKTGMEFDILSTHGDVLVAAMQLLKSNC